MAVVAKKPKKWMPTIGSLVTAYLPTETLRATVMKHLTQDSIEVILDVQPPLAKSHTYRYRQKIVLHRAPMQPIGEKWETIEDV